MSSTEAESNDSASYQSEKGEMRKDLIRKSDTMSPRSCLFLAKLTWTPIAFGVP